MKKSVIMAPSILAADFLHLDEEIVRLEEADIKWLHYDVMDGHFVPAISFGSEILKQIKRRTDFYLDVHIMVTNPEKVAKLLIEAGADNITFHYEASDDPNWTIQQIRNIKPNINVGMSIKPDTSVDQILEYLPSLDLILIMAVEPGKGGQSFNLEALDKIEQLRNYIDSNGLSCKIEVDGGINSETGTDSFQAGADILVAGTYIFTAADISEAIKAIGHTLEEY